MPSTIKGLRDESIAREKVEGGGRVVNGSRLETIIQNVASETSIPDDLTLERNDEIWQVKSGGIDTDQLAADAVTNAKLGSDVKVGSLAALTTGVITSITAAINWLVSLVNAHHTRHEAGGSDAIKLDDLAAPDDNTDLNATTSAHGLLKKLSNSATEFMNGQGNWATPSTGATTFLALTDTPPAYTSSAYYIVEVNAAATGLQFKGIGDGYVVRGTSTGLGTGLLQDDNVTVGINGNPGIGMLNISYAGTTCNGLFITMSNGSALAGLSISHAGNTPGGEVEHTGTGHGWRGYINNTSSSADAISGETTGTGAGVHGTGTGAGGVGLKGSGDIALHINGGLQQTTTLVTGTTHTLDIAESEVHFKLSAGCTVALPSLSILHVGWRCRLRDNNNNIAANNVTFNRDGSDLFTSGATSWLWATSNGSADLVVVDFGSGSKRWYHS
jgi:hypothetical protein